MIVLGSEELKSLIFSVVRFTVSKALVRSKEVTKLCVGEAWGG